MSFAIVAGVGGTIAGSLIAADAAGDASDAQAQSAREADATQRYMYDQTRKDNAPFRDVGVSANNRLAELMGLKVQGQSTFDPAAYLRDNPDVAAQPYWAADPYKHYMEYGQREGRNMPQTGGQSASGPVSADFGSLSRSFTMADRDADPVYQSGLQFGLDQGAQGINRQAAAGGGFMSGATLKALTRFGNDYGSTKANESYNRFNNNQDRSYNKLAGLSGAGQQATNQVSAAGQNAGNQISASQMGAGNARASGYLAQSNALQNGINGAVSGFKNFGGQAAPQSAYGTGFGNSLNSFFYGNGTSGD